MGSIFDIYNDSYIVCKRYQKPSRLLLSRRQIDRSELSWFLKKILKK